MSTACPHFAKNVFFSCMDDRLVKPHQTFIDGIGGAFYPSLAGGGLALTVPEQRSIALKQIVTAYQINHVNHIYLESHIDCGAYHLAGVIFGSQKEEIQRLYSDLNIARTEVQAALAQAGAAEGEITVITRVVDLRGKLVPNQSVAQPAQPVLS
jgi:carbonic anhydrase